MSIFTNLLKPIQEIDNEIDRITSSSHVKDESIRRVAELLIMRAELKAKLAVANATTPCSNGATILENLEQMYAWRTAAGIARRAGSEVLSESYNNSAEQLRIFINNANSKGD